MLKEECFKEIKEKLEEMVKKDSPGGTVVPGFATGEHLGAIGTVIGYLQHQGAKVGAKQSILDFIEQYVKTPYMAQLFEFAVSSYGGKDLTDDDFKEIGEKYKQVVESIK